MIQNKATVKQLYREQEVAGRTAINSKHAQNLEDKFLKSVDGHVVGLVDTDSYEAEQYRKLCYALEEKRKSHGALVVGVCSPVARDGKSLTAINLAGILAQDTQEGVLLIDVDLRRKSESLKASLPLGRQGVAGLTEIVSDESIALSDVVRNAPVQGIKLDLIQTGLRSIAPYEVLHSPKFKALLDNARENYSYIILDTPPVVPVSDCRVISKYVDTFIMVVSANHTPRDMLEEALNLMRPEKLLGLVFNRAEQMSSKYYGYYGYYGYGKPTKGRHTDSGR